MGKTKFYAIKVGRKTGIYTDWSEAQEYVIGYKGAIFKSFTTESDARAYLKEPNHSPKRTGSPKNSKKTKRAEEIERYWSYAARRERMNKDRDRYKYSIQDRTFDYYSDRSQKRKK